MNSTIIRDAILEALKRLPVEATLEDVMEHLYFIAKLEPGRQQSNERDLNSHEAVESRLMLKIPLS